MRLKTIFPTTLALALSFGCAGPDKTMTDLKNASDTIARVQQNAAPDSHLAVFDVRVSEKGGQFVLTGEVDSADAKRQVVEAVSGLGRAVEDEITLLPDANLNGKVWGISSIS